MHQSADPDTFYDQVIMPCEGLLEEWYVEHQSLSVYFKCIWLTVLVVLKPDSDALWQAFPDLPAPPAALRALRNGRP